MKLVAMSQGYFDAFLERVIVEYADDKVRSGNWPKDGALERSRIEILKLLSEGLETESQALFELMVPGEDEPAGAIWLASVERNGIRFGFVYDLWIRPDLRRKGLGVQAMQGAEAWTKALGLEALALHVFGHNPEALSLYQKLGYRITDINMTKALS